MVTPTTGALAACAIDPHLAAIAADLRAVYAEAFEPALEEATEARSRFEAADGSGTVDPDYAADIVGCRAVNASLVPTVAEHLPDAQLLDRIDEPAVIDSCWLHQRRIFVIEWDLSYDFGDPDALVVREVGR
ncbi:MAG: hypothetical protein AAGA65_10340 [Actinomycetota bacterium]